MPGEGLVSVWEAAYSLDKNPQGHMPQELLKKVTMSFGHIPGVSSQLSEQKMDEVFPTSTVKYKDYKTFVQSRLLDKGYALFLLEDDIEKVCWDGFCSIEYEDGDWAWGLDEEELYKSWQIFNRLAEEDTYPAIVRMEELNWLGRKMAASMSCDWKRLEIGEGINFRKMMDILVLACFSGCSSKQTKDCIDGIHCWLVKEICQAGWMKKRTKKRSNWTNWRRRWFVLTPGKLAYYENPALEDLQGEMTITPHSKLENMDDYRGLIGNLGDRFKVTNKPYLEIELCAESSDGKTMWMNALKEVIGSARMGMTPVQALLQLRHKRRKEKRQDKNDEMDKQLNLLHINANKIRKSQGLFFNKQVIDLKSSGSNAKEKSQDAMVTMRSPTKKTSNNSENNMYSLQQKKIRTVFLVVDTNKDGQISKREFSQFVKNLGAKLTESEKNMIFDSIDEDKNGQLSLKEFEKYFLNFIMNDSDIKTGSLGAVESKLRAAFLEADRNGTGILEFKEFTEFAWEKRRSVQVNKLLQTLKKGDSKASPSDPNLTSFVTNHGLAALEEDQVEAAPETASKPDNCDTLDHYLQNLSKDNKEVEVTAGYLKQLWKKSASEKRQATCEQMLTGNQPKGSLALSGERSLVDLACINFLPPITPKHVVIKDFQWLPGSTPCKAGQALFPEDFDGKIPVDIATSEHLSYYGANLADSNQVKLSQLYRHSIHDFTYQNQDLEEMLGGAGLERHGFSHLDCPLDEDSGYFIIGKLEGSELHLTAFKVLTRHTLYLPGAIIHSKDYLRGTWQTMLAEEAEIDHVHLVRKPDIEGKQLQKLTFDFQN